MPDKSWFNTISLKGEALKEANANAAFQETVIIAIFKDNPGAKLSPSMVFDIFATELQRNVPITSIRRAMTNLTKRDGILEKTPEQRMGLYNHPEYLWKIKTEAAGEREMYQKGQDSAGDIAIKMLSGGIKPESKI